MTYIPHVGTDNQTKSKYNALVKAKLFIFCSIIPIYIYCQYSQLISDRMKDVSEAYFDSHRY